ncbi:MAG: acetylxylan esterase [Pirellulaceae bacterium]|nr:acetylxylan esterase [Pirellulaceae bacterium]
MFRQSAARGCIAGILTMFSGVILANDLRVYPPGQQPNDARLGELRNLNGYFPFQVPASRGAWEARAAELRRRVLVATGLWPLPKRTPLNTVIHGKVKRPGFSVEKVYFESMPNHFVTGLLYRPLGGEENERRPAVLCPHGHGGRLQDYGADQMEQLIESGGEKFLESGRFPKLARCAQLARMGCVVFIYDMLGYADSVQISYAVAHRMERLKPEKNGRENWGLYSTQAELRLQSIFSIQTWNSIRGLDFLQSLPDVDPERLAVTGGSGGGTQTILLGAVDQRPIAAFPNGMVSTSMQGGCMCENCSLLRVDSGNVELAALFAPRPQAMTAVNDWTKDMMTSGYPELQQLYEMLGVKENVYCREMLEFPHNYNYPTRQTMYAWFNKHLDLGHQEPIEETDYQLLSPAEYSVWNDDHPSPEGGDDYEITLMRYMADVSKKQLEAVAPNDATSLQRFREIIGGAFQAIVGRGVPAYDDIQRTKVAKEELGGALVFADRIRLQSRGEELPVISLFPKSTAWNGDVVIWIDGAGKRGMFDDAGVVHSEVQRLLDGGRSVVGVDLFQQGEFLAGNQRLEKQRDVNPTRDVAAYTFCYNDSLLVRRVHDILTVISWVKFDEHAPKRVNLVGVNGGGPIAALARAISGKAIDLAAIDSSGFRFEKLATYLDPNFLPGAVKYGDFPSVLALSAPNSLWVGGDADGLPSIVGQAFAASGNPAGVTVSPLQNVSDAAVEWLLSK